MLGVFFQMERQTDVQGPFEVGQMDDLEGRTDVLEEGQRDDREDGQTDHRELMDIGTV